MSEPSDQDEPEEPMTPEEMRKKMQERQKEETDKPLTQILREKRDADKRKIKEKYFD